MGVASLRAMIGLLDSLHREDSPGIHTPHPAVLSTTRISLAQPDHYFSPRRLSIRNYKRLLEVQKALTSTCKNSPLHAGSFIFKF